MAHELSVTEKINQLYKLRDEKGIESPEYNQASIIARETETLDHFIEGVFEFTNKNHPLDLVLQEKIGILSVFRPILDWDEQKGKRIPHEAVAHLDRDYTQLVETISSVGGGLPRQPTEEDMQKLRQTAQNLHFASKKKAIVYS